MIPLIVFLVTLAWVGAIFWFAKLNRKPHGARPVGLPPKPQLIESDDLSCFVKGLIRSIRETPAEWRCWVDLDGDDDHCLFSSRGVSLHYKANDSYYPRQYDHPAFSRSERLALKDVIHTVLYQPTMAKARSTRAQRAADRLRAMAAQRAPFEALGCPSGHESGADISS